MNQLSPIQIRYLRGLAHALNPLVIIGQHGLTESVLKEIGHVLFDHELIKVRVNAEDRQGRIDIIDTICNSHECEFIQRIGHVAVFYKRNPKQNRIRVPKDPGVAK